jgi:hypothetical protein
MASAGEAAATLMERDGSYHGLLGGHAADAEGTQVLHAASVIEQEPHCQLHHPS